ncbi:DUF4338 domain-containing protein [Pseudoxanthomonas daejeonensis]|uniref:Druantia anti-phage system protein DruA n=1 Tax=Pseudoxanthomonas daejeonensis TaxID=266062 RepID=UPI001F545B7D|nr:Druantia anti-phage system protein DruA [Pseudoxanthomonas daejeonensis]UNK58900.1 DUF4338 domain-containing protein [Pseudoxanthomonas daejeonensis]
MSRKRTEFAKAALASGYIDKQVLLAVGLILSDLAIQGWRIRVRSQSVAVCPPLIESENRGAEKARIRRQELVKRDAQLRQPSVQAFLRSMERSRLFDHNFVSIFSLMRDGRELADKLRAARLHPANGRDVALSGVVDPYIEFVKTEASKCAHTGMRLMDIWRYFRHNWSNQYTSVPGRSMLFMVRDKAAPLHPVIGIGALCSPIMQLRERDEWIGWQPEAFLAHVRANPSQRLAKWFVETLDGAISEVYIDDFIEDGILTARDLTAPGEGAIGRLLAEGLEQRESHHRFARQREHKRFHSNVEDKWVERARSHLFRSKRALALASYLRIRAVLKEAGKGPFTAERLETLAGSPRGVDAIKKILRKAKGDRVGICVADISVCGAVQPYNAILGGKLVAMLAASPEVALEYRHRYSDAQSEIASAMAGRPIRRAPHLVLLGTTSLYGVGSSQYNRIRVPCDRLGGATDENLRYKELGHSESFGTSQYADDTVEALTELAQQSANGSRVNSIFGEGVSPKLRKVRRGLELLGLPADVLLRHYRHRIVYGVSLIRNLRDYLLGLDPEPSYFVPVDASASATAQIGAWWLERWLRNRIESDEVLAEVERHTLIRPVQHGARVPVLPEGNQASLLSVSE